MKPLTPKSLQNAALIEGYLFEMIEEEIKARNVKLAQWLMTYTTIWKQFADDAQLPHVPRARIVGEQKIGLREAMEQAAAAHEGSAYGPGFGETMNRAIPNTEDGD